MTDVANLSDDERALAKLGYKQELDRSWSGFSNFAISFSIISILAGCFTTFGQGFNNGGPIAISWGWPLVSMFILIIGLTMSELVSAYPTSGGIYWWASKLGGAKAGFFTGWLNLIGLIAVTASVAYGCATFVDLTLSTLSKGYAGGYSLTRVFLIFLVVLALGSLMNIFSGHLMAVINNVSVWWHVVGVAFIVVILLVVPDQHQSFSYVFTERFNNSGYASGANHGATYWLLVAPFGLLLTQYTITGFDASAHLSEETSAASSAAAKGIWQSIFYSAVGGWILLLAFLFAVPSLKGAPDNAGVGAGGVAYIFTTSLGTNLAGLVLFISAAGQLFCTMACMTSASRMTFAFSRDGAIPASRLWSKLTAAKVPANAVVLVAVVSAIITLPALIRVNIGTAKAPLIVPTAFYAIVAVAVIGLYLAFLIPIWLRWR
ncbi:MAG: amino acid permease, partial [Marmoricola sp.]